MLTSFWLASLITELVADFMVLDFYVLLFIR